MPESIINLIKGDRVDDNTDYRDALPVNMYAVKRAILGADGYMLSYPGLTKYADGSGIDRAGVYNDRFSAQYRVSGGKFISVNTNGTTTELGTISGTTQSTLEGFYSFNTQGVIADGKFYLYDSVNGFRQVTDPDIGDPIDGVWVDGIYFMTDGESLFHTDSADEESISPLAYGVAEFMPDKSLGLGKTQDNKVMVWGRYTLEYFINRATTNFQFERVATRAQKIGIVATHAKCESGGNWYITGGRKEESVSVHAIGIGSSENVATREVDKILAKYTEPQLADMRMESRTEDKVTFILLHLPNETLCFNVSIAKAFGIDTAWTILKTDVAGDNKYRAINGAFDARLGYWTYGDKLTGNIGKLDKTVCTHYDEIVEWILYTPFLMLESMSVDELELETIPGHTTTDDATVAFSMTVNGLTFGTEWFNMYGEPNDYCKRFIIRRLGDTNDWVGFKFRGATRSRMAFASAKVTYG